MKRVLILTCEHAVNTIPYEYTALFKHQAEVLKTHRGIDIGAKAMADHLAQYLPCDFYQSAEVSRLLIDCNRSLKNKHCFSEWTHDLNMQEKNQIIERYYHSFRLPVINHINALIGEKKSVLHLSIHSFTPVLKGEKRNADIGLLYDPKRVLEKKFALEWKNQLTHETPEYRVRMNYPYLGTSDGFTQSLRKRYHEKQYIGLELESNQALMNSKTQQEALIHAVETSLLRVL